MASSTHQFHKVWFPLALLLICGSQYFVTGDGSDLGQHPIIDFTESEVQSTINSSEKTISYWRTMAKEKITEKVEATLVKGIAKNVILFMGDGMSVPTLTAARIYMGQLNNETGESGQLSFEKFPFSGFSKTYCVNAQVGESACTSVAYLGGVKANSGTLGVSAAVTRDNCTESLDTSNHVDTILNWAQDAGKATGLVTTTRITHASPAGNYAHVPERNWESDADMGTSSGSSSCEDIAKQLVKNAPGKNCKRGFKPTLSVFNGVHLAYACFRLHGDGTSMLYGQSKVIMGGGRAKFLPSNSTGKRTDNIDLVSVWMEDKTTNGSNASYVTTREELLAIDTDKTDYLMGLFQDSHMLYHLEDGSDEQPSLAEMTEYAIKILSKESNGFYLFVEGGRIDMAHHENWARRSLDETNEFQKAIQVAADLLDEKETLIVVTADHAHTMSFSGYPSRGNDILEYAGTGSDQIKYTTLSYANGQSAESNRTNGTRHDVGADNLTSSSYLYPSLFPLGSETHGGDDVAVYARGPWAHLLTGNYEQTLIPLVMAYAANIGPMALRDETAFSSTVMTTQSTTTTSTTTESSSSSSSATASQLSGSVMLFVLSTTFYLVH